MFALSLNFVGAGQAQAAPCSTKDKLIFGGGGSEEASTDFVFSYLMAGEFGKDVYIDRISEIVKSWKKTTKSKKLKAALIKFEIEFEVDGKNGITKYKYIPELSKAYKNIQTIFKYDRC